MGITPARWGGTEKLIFSRFKNTLKFPWDSFFLQSSKKITAALQLQFYVSTGFWGSKHPSNLVQTKSIFLLNTDHEEKHAIET